MKAFAVLNGIEISVSCQTSEVQPSEVSDLLSVLRDVTDYASRQHCPHEETYRGGVLWEICSQCGMKWADDEGGKPDDAGKLPEEIDRAYDILAKYPGIAGDCSTHKITT